MGCNSSSMKEQVASTALEPLPGKVVALSATHCANTTTKMLVKFTRAVVFDNITYTVYDHSNDQQGELIFWLDGYQVLTDGDKLPITKFIGNIYTKGFTTVDLNTNIALFTLKRFMRPSLPAELGTFRDRISGREYTIGYTGEWTLEHRAIIWLTTETEPEKHIPVAKVYPVGGVGVNVKFCVEVAPGMDRSILVLICYVLDYAGDESFYVN